MKPKTEAAIRRLAVLAEPDPRKRPGNAVRVLKAAYNRGDPKVRDAVAYIKNNFSSGG